MLLVKGRCAEMWGGDVLRVTAPTEAASDAAVAVAAAAAAAAAANFARLDAKRFASPESSASTSVWIATSILISFVLVV